MYVCVGRWPAGRARQHTGTVLSEVDLYSGVSFRGLGPCSTSFEFLTAFPDTLFIFEL
jgi:hypothetical protein